MRSNFFSFIALFIFTLFNAQYISVNTTTYTPEQLIKDVFIGSQNASCIAVSNVSVTGWNHFGSNPFSYGYFEKGSLPFDIEKGIILSTGDVQNAVGPNNVLLDDQASNWLGDTDLAAALQENPISYLNATILEFDFIANQTTGISFEYMFLSEEYRKINCTYSDAFAFLIKEAGSFNPYENIALVPGTQEPVTSLTINPAQNCQRNAQFFGQFNDNPTSSPTAFDGQTVVLTAKADITPGVKYHIKLVIADHLAGNDRTGRYDSAVFLKAGSFVGKKDLGPDLVTTTNNPLCERTDKILDATTPGATFYKWYKDGVLIHQGATDSKYQVQGNPSSSGTYEVEINLSGCVLKGSIKIEIEEKPTINYGVIPLCDLDLDGKIAVNFGDIDSQVVTNFNSSFVPKYYLQKADAQSGAPNFLQNEWLLTADTKIYIRVESIFGCAPIIGEFLLKIGDKFPLLANSVVDDICDDDLDGEISFDLNNYNNSFSTIVPLFYNSLQDAKENKNPISGQQKISTDTQTFGLRFDDGISCPNVATITINKKSPKKSTDLEDKIICENSTTDLNAGPGFTSYLWSNGEKTAEIKNVGIGDYYVDLGFNGCVYRQFVKVIAAELPQITHIDVSGNTATIFVIGGNPPYMYSLDGISFQSSNVFTNVERGLRTVYVKDKENCGIVMKDFLVLNLINTITPNNDGKNDVLDYSDLKIKNNVKFKIFDRFGALIFDAKNQNFIWDGKLNGKGLPTGSYWYVLEWTEPDTNLPVSYKGWIFLKNRN